MNIHNRPTLLIYRDMIRLIKTVMESNKQKGVLLMLRKEFDKNKNISDKDEITKLKKNACMSIGNMYLLYVKQTVKDNKDAPNKDNLI